MPAKPNEIEIIRIYDAPVKLVWEAWTELKHVEKWWGPRGFTLTTKSKDLRPGGKWIYTMHGPDGTDYPNIATYHEVEKYKKLVYDHGGNEDRPKLFTVTVTFREENGKTIMHMISTLPTAEEAQAMKKHIKMANGYSTWDRLAEYLENENGKKDVFIISRSFNADIKSVYEMWINPDKYVQWMGPNGATMSFANHDIKEGGSSHWSMTTSDGQTKYGKLNYKKLAPPELIAYTQNFSDKHGQLIKAPFSQSYPDILLTTVNLCEEEPNRTRITVRWEAVGDPTDAELKTFVEMKPIMTTGWNESFDKMEDLLGS